MAMPMPAYSANKKQSAPFSLLIVNIHSKRAQLPIEWAHGSEGESPIFLFTSQFFGRMFSRYFH